ncbi:hypothetical protein MKW92_038491, partial [Papaver armeniacum]
MPRTRQSSQTASPSADTNVDEDQYCHCPFKHFEECSDGVGGKGYVKTSILKHIHDRHAPTAAAISTCKARICTE